MSTLLHLRLSTLHRYPGSLKYCTPCQLNETSNQTPPQTKASTATKPKTMTLKVSDEDLLRVALLAVDILLLKTLAIKEVVCVYVYCTEY